VGKRKSFAGVLWRLEQEVGRTAQQGQPERLPVARIKTAVEVFQPRNIDFAWLATDSHVKALVGALKDGNTFDPLVVWWSGRHWYVIDGHHRLMAYQRANKDAKLKIDMVPVTVFEGTVDEAIRQAVTLNAKDKLPMRKNDKLEKAWILVCLNDGWTSKQIHDATTISVRTIKTMRNMRRRLSANGVTNLFNRTWQEVRAGSASVDHDENWVEQQAIQWQKRLVKHFGKKFAEQPEIAARALELYSERLPEELVRFWPDLARRAAEEEKELGF